MSTAEPDSLGLLLHDARRAVVRRFEARAASHGLSSAQWRLLFALKRLGPCTQARLAERLEIEPISVSRLIDRAEEAGWVTREADPADRRSKVVVPTARALKTFDSIRAIADTVYAEALAGLPDAARAALYDGLRRIIANLGETEPVCRDLHRPESSGSEQNE
ncbi:MAG: MarR family winged helix-turn-helix transcriptional regulator [Pseudomonadota bacterium]